jgi:hypothetical protein
MFFATAQFSHQFLFFFQFFVSSVDCLVVSAGKLRKLCDFLSELRSSLCERRTEMTVLSSALLPVKNCAVPSISPPDMTLQ